MDLNMNSSTSIVDCSKSLERLANPVDDDDDDDDDDESLCNAFM